jgi:hypothetical protein
MNTQHKAVLCCVLCVCVVCSFNIPVCTVVFQRFARRWSLLISDSVCMRVRSKLSCMPSVSVCHLPVCSVSQVCRLNAENRSTGFINYNELTESQILQHRPDARFQTHRRHNFELIIQSTNCKIIICWRLGDLQYLNEPANNPTITMTPEICLRVN